MTCFIECWKCSSPINCYEMDSYYYVEMFIYKDEYVKARDGVEKEEKAHEVYRYDVFICPECLSDLVQNN